ncbi:MAG TPA: TonB-dependent receptor [Acidobacteriota bacterium]
MRSLSLLRILITTIFVLMLASLLSAQSGRGTLTGVVTDPQGAVVPGVDVTATDKKTGVANKSISTDAGVYRIPYLPAGTYKVTAALPGFKTALADNVEVHVTEVVTVDFRLEVGEVSEQVIVSAEAPLLEKSTSEIGTVTTEKEVHTWPIIVGDGTRQIQNFIFTSMPGTQGNEFAGSINGGQSYSHEILIDGISVGRFDLNGGNTNEFTPTIDALSEFKLQTGALSSQYGNTQTALANFGLKAGTNDYHGGMFWFHKQKAFNANSWGANRLGLKKTGARENNAGATFGGPIIKNRTHFFFSYEGERLSDQTVGGTQSLPIAPFKKGDFSLLLDPKFTGDTKSGTVVGTDALGRPVIFGQIYDPFSARQLPNGTWIRDPFPGNIIPQNKFSQVALNVLKFDIPNPLLFQFRRNNPSIGVCCPFLDIDNWSLKIDHTLSDAHKFSVAFISNDRSRRRFGAGASSYPHLPGPIPGPFAAGDKTQATPGEMVRLAEDWTISPTALNHFAFGYNQFRNSNQSNAALSGVDFTQALGLKNVGQHSFPRITFSGFNVTLTGGYPGLGHNGGGNAPNGSGILEDDFTWIRGSHSFRFGAEHRRYFLNERTNFGTGSYAFHNENTGLSGFTTSTGFAYASFLLGAVRSTGLFIPLLTPGERSRTTALYVQDDWKFSPRLTLNLGLRWDIPTPITEVRHRMSGLNPTKPNPGADGFPGAFEMLGNCSGCSGRESFADIYWKEFSPRIGFAYSPGASSRIVVRGGYGINYTPPIQDGFNFPYTVGFDGSNPIIQRTGRFREDPSYLWDNPYPPFTKKLPNPDPALLNGDDIGYYIPQTNKLPYVQNWNFGVQTELGWRTVLEVNYVGNKGTRLNEPQYLYSLNQVDPKFLSLGDKLLDDIADHPEIKKPYPSFEGTVAQALRPFPQYQTVNTHRLNNGWSTYHALQVTATKRSSVGLSFLAAYTFSKALGTGDTAGPGNYYDYGQNFYNRRADYSVTTFNVPHDLKLTWIYDLPWGPGRRWLSSGFAGAILGGWTMSAIQRYSSGAPLNIGVCCPDGSALFNPGFRGDVLLPRNQQVLNDNPSSNVDPDNGTPYLNPKAFGNTPVTANNVPLRFGNAPRWLPNLRGFRQSSEDFSLIKRTALGFREGANFEIRMDAVNILNRVRLGDPNTDASDPGSFGRVFGKCCGPRNIQLGLRLTF